MALEKTTQLYEVLFRFENGAFKAAHYQEIEQITEDGAIIADTVKGAVPLEVGSEKYNQIMNLVNGG